LLKWLPSAPCSMRSLLLPLPRTLVPSCALSVPNKCLSSFFKKIRNWTSVENKQREEGEAEREDLSRSMRQTLQGFFQIRRDNGSLIHSCRISPMFPVVHPMIDLLGLQEKKSSGPPSFSDLWMLPDQSLTCFSASATVISPHLSRSCEPPCLCSGPLLSVGHPLSWPPLEHFLCKTHL